MTDLEVNRIIEEKKRKYLPPRSNQIFHAGVIFLVSLIIGLIYFHFEPVPESVKPEDVSLFRQGLGIWLGIFIALCGAICYLLWTVWRSYKFQKEAKAEILAAALKELEKSST